MGYRIGNTYYFGGEIVCISREGIRNGYVYFTYCTGPLADCDLEFACKYLELD